MTEHDISRLLDKMQAAYPNNKISPTKVLDLWRLKRELLEFPTQRMADLVNALLDRCKEFPTMPELLAACEQVVPRPRVIKDSCLMCDDTGYIHYEDDGELISGRIKYRVVPGATAADGTPVDNRAVFSYNGKPIEYFYPRPCPICTN
jgi:hypothetical protein